MYIFGLAGLLVLGEGYSPRHSGRIGGLVGALVLLLWWPGFEADWQSSGVSGDIENAVVDPLPVELLSPAEAEAAAATEPAEDAGAGVSGSGVAIGDNLVYWDLQRAMRKHTAEI